MKRLLSLLLSIALVLSLVPSALAATDEALSAANALHELGLFNGTGTDANGNPNFDLDRAPTRHEAITMLVRLLGKEAEAKAGTWNTPFTDVAEWAKPYVGYAYANGLANGTSGTTFGGDNAVTAAQYLTFVLRVLGYASGTDFQWNKAWELSDKIGLTDGRYNENTVSFARGDAAIVSYNSLSANLKNSSTTLRSVLFPQSSIEVEAVELSKTVCTIEVGSTESIVATVAPFNATEKTITWQSSNASIVAVSSGIITGIAAGNAIITATSANGKSAQCTVVVKPASILATGVTINRTNAELSVGDSLQLTASVVPSNADANNTVTWSTSNSSILTVSNTGLVTAVQKGIATVYATLPDGTRSICNITVSSDTVKIILRDGLPKTLSYYNSRNEIKNTWTVTDFRYEVTTYKYKDTCTVNIYFSGSKIFDANGSGQGDACRISWQLFDADGYVVGSGTVYSPSVRVGESFRDGKGHIYDLTPGTYYLEISSTN